MLSMRRAAGSNRAAVLRLIPEVYLDVFGALPFGPLKVVDFDIPGHLSKGLIAVLLDQASSDLRLIVLLLAQSRLILHLFI